MTTPQRTTVLVPEGAPWDEGRQVAAVLRAAGHETYAVGGCVRDLLLEQSVADVDLATAADPNTVEALAAAAGLHTVAVGKSFGVIVVVMPSGQHVEVATFRNDGVYLDGRRPSAVVFADAVSDVERRDFTFNALLLDLDTNIVIDHVGGLGDLAQRCLRSVGDPQRRFAEDQLRVLRALRFAAHLGCSIESATWTALGSPDLSGLARERIIQEWTKAMSAAGRGRWLDSSVTSGVLGRWCPPARGLLATALAPVVAALDRLPGNADPRVGQALLLLAIGPAALPWLAEQPLARRDAELLRWLYATTTRRDDVLRRDHPVGLFRTLQGGEGDLLSMLLRAWDPEWTGHADLERALADPRSQREWRSCVSASDVLAAGWQAGPPLGEALRRLADAELAGVVRDRDSAIAWLRASSSG